MRIPRTLDCKVIFVSIKRQHTDRESVTPGGYTRSAYLSLYVFVFCTSEKEEYLTSLWTRDVENSSFVPALTKIVLFSLLACYQG